MTDAFEEAAKGGMLVPVEQEVYDACVDRCKQLSADAGVGFHQLSRQQPERVGLRCCVFRISSTLPSPPFPCVKLWVQSLFVVGLANPSHRATRTTSWHCPLCSPRPELELQQRRPTRDESAANKRRFGRRSGGSKRSAKKTVRARAVVEEGSRFSLSLVSSRGGV